MYLFAFLTVLRETLEAGLLVCLLLATLRRTGCHRNATWVWVGVLAAVLPVAGILGAASWGERLLGGRAHLNTEAVLLALSAAAVTAVILWIRGTATRELAGLAACPRYASPAGVFLLTLLLTAREGLETVLLLLGPLVQGGGADSRFLASALGAVAVSLLAAYALYRRVAALPLRAFFTVSGGLLVLLGGGLVANTVQSWQQLGWLPTLAVVWDTSGLVPPGGFLASILAALFGYNARPTILEAVGWWGYVLLVGALYLAGLRRAARAAGPIRPGARPGRGGAHALTTRD